MRSVLQVGEVVSGEQSAYRLVYQIGEGGMGEVWEATDLRWSYQVAVKFMRDDSPSLRMRFKREANVLRTLSHPSIVRLIDDGETPDGRPFLVIELLTGQTLDTFLRKNGPLPLRTALQVARDIASALAAVHAAGIVHRDLKPANIYLHGAPTPNDPHVDVVVFDFGIARDVNSTGEAQATMTNISTTVGTILGSHGYMSPEQLRGRAVDRSADIWALGLVLYEMIEGTRLFSGTREQMIRQALSTPITPIPWRTNKNVPKEVDLIVASCLERDLSRRTTSAQELEQRLTQLIESSVLWTPRADAQVEATIAMPPRMLSQATAIPSLPPIEAPSAVNAVYPQVLAIAEQAPIADKAMQEQLTQMQRQMRTNTLITVTSISLCAVLSLVATVQGMNVPTTPPPPAPAVTIQNQNGVSQSPAATQLPVATTSTAPTQTDAVPTKNASPEAPPKPANSANAGTTEVPPPCPCPCPAKPKDAESKPK
ncbi:MAG TPA: serine/threonine-protein kinase [Polyangium sp.]|nr:serine/threonine-protein kinase [Polyangium sp.]